MGTSVFWDTLTKLETLSWVVPKGRSISTLSGSLFSFFCSFYYDFVKRGSRSIRLDSRVLVAVFPSSIADYFERETEFWSLFALEETSSGSLEVAVQGSYYVFVCMIL